MLKQVLEPIPRPDSHFEGTSSLKAEGATRVLQNRLFDCRSPDGHWNPPSYPPKQMYAPAHPSDRPSLPVSPSPRLYPPGRDRFSSLPPPGRDTNNRGNVFHLRSSISNVNLHAPSPRSRIDLDTDRLARACGQDALSASTSFSGGVNTLGVTLGDWWVPVPAHRADSQDRNPHLEAINKAPIPPPRHFPFPDLEVTIQLLDAELNKHNIWLGEHIHIEDVLLGESPSDTTFSYGTAARRQESSERHYVFGSALENVDPRLMTSTLLSGYLHDVPLLVSQCIGELYRTGMYQPGLFRTLPDRSRLHRLIRQFDNSVVEPFNVLHTIASETTSNVCALLLEYIAALPDPLLPRSIFNALWEWCIVPASSYETSICRSLSSSEGRSRSKNERKGCNGPSASYPDGDVRNAPSDKTRIDQTRGRRPGSYTIGPSSMGSRLPYYVSRSALDAQLREAESSQIQITQYLLLLLPRRSLSLLLYLLSFFSQLPLSPENGMTFDDVARIFAHSLLGGPSEGASRVMMVWLLNRSSRLLEKFEPTEDDSASTPSDLSSLFSSPSSRCSSATDAYTAKFRQDAAKEKALRRQLSSVIQERDEAIRMVREMKRVVNPDPNEFRPRTV